MHDLVTVMKALSDETRLRILNLLLERECCVCEVMQALAISQSRASRNLGILEDAGLLKARRLGAWMFYAVNSPTVNRFAASVTELLKDSFSRHEMLAKDREKLKQTVRIGPGCR